MSTARVVAWRELRDNWLTGRGLALMFGFSILLSLATYLAATNEALTFLEQRESLALVLKVAVTVGGLLVVLWCADAISGERERATLEGLLLTPASRRGIVVGKGLSALSLWFAAYLCALPYLWILGRGSAVSARSCSRAWSSARCWRSSSPGWGCCSASGPGHSGRALRWHSCCWWPSTLPR